MEVEVGSAPLSLYRFHQEWYVTRYTPDGLVRIMKLPWFSVEVPNAVYQPLIEGHGGGRGGGGGVSYPTSIAPTGYVVCTEEARVNAECSAFRV